MTDTLTEGLRKREAWLIGLMRVGIGLTVAMSAFLVVETLFLKRIDGQTFAGVAVTEGFADIVYLAGGVVGLFFLAFFIGSIIAYGLWVMRAANIAKRRAPGIMKISPRWAFAWNVVPIASFWMPFRAVAQAWRAGGEGDPQEPLPRVFYLWWICWLLANLLGQVSWRLEEGATSVEQLAIPIGIGTFADALSVVACFGLIKVVGHIRGRFPADHREEVAVFE